MTKKGLSNEWQGEFFYSYKQNNDGHMKTMHSSCLRVSKKGFHFPLFDFYFTSHKLRDYYRSFKCFQTTSFCMS